MKTAFRSNYGAPDVLQIVEKTKPVPRENEILVRVFATTVNRTDCGILTGKPYVIRLFTGLIKPSPTTGTDFAGTIESVGKNVRKFKPGDKVWGFDDGCIGSHSEFITISETKPILIIPDGIAFEQAAASIEGAHYAFNFINKVNIKPGDKILVNGATGAIGSAAVQLLKAMGASVTAVANTPNLDMIKSLGADRVIDYLKEDFTKDNQQYHFVFDAVGKSRFSKCKDLLLPGGVYISSELGPNWENTYLPLITSFKGDKKVKFPLPVNIKKSMELVKDLIEKGKFKPVIDRIYPLEDIAEAYRYVLTGQKTGNVVILMNTTKQ